MQRFNTELLIGKTLLIGAIISAVLVLCGGIGYLWQNGAVILQKEHISVRAEKFNMHSLIDGLSNNDPTSYILLGVLILFCTQLLRVMLTALLFLTNNEYILFGVSCFVFVALLGTTIINFVV